MRAQYQVSSSASYLTDQFVATWKMKWTDGLTQKRWTKSNNKISIINKREKKSVVFCAVGLSFQLELNFWIYYDKLLLKNINDKAEAHRSGSGSDGGSTDKK